MTDIIEGRIEQCSLCDEAAASVSFVDHNFNYGPVEDGIELVARVPVINCAACGERYTGAEADEIMHDAVCRHLGRMTPREIKGVRVRFDMRQEEFAAFTGYGSASIKRWEAGSQIQSESVDKHLRLLKSLGVAEATKRASPPVPPTFSRDFDQTTRDVARKFELRKSIYEVEPELMAA